MKFTLESTPGRPWQLTIEGLEDLVMDLLVAHYGGNTEVALDHYEDAERTGDPGRVRIAVPLRAATSEQDAARALLDLLTNTPGFSHG